jgi:uncharacterized membrane protein YebE (DUF533 family)
MNHSLEIIILGAAIDGTVDNIEQNYILQMLRHSKKFKSLQKSHLQVAQKNLLTKLQSGITPEVIISNVNKIFDYKKKIQIYAIILDVAYSNNVLEQSEIEFLDLLENSWELKRDDVLSLNFSAKLRFGEDWDE